MVWLRMAIWGAKVICGVKYRVQGMDNLPSADDSTSAVVLAIVGALVAAYLHFKGGASEPRRQVVKIAVLPDAPPPPPPPGRRRRSPSTNSLLPGATMLRLPPGPC